MLRLNRALDTDSPPSLADVLPDLGQSPPLAKVARRKRQREKCTPVGSLSEPDWDEDNGMSESVPIDVVRVPSGSMPSHFALCVRGSGVRSTLLPNVHHFKPIIECVFQSYT